MNEAAAASKALEDVANNQVIMMELVLYAIISIVLILLMDLWAGKVIGNKQSMEYKVLRIPKYISLFIICGFTVIVGIMCLYNQDFSVTRSTLTYFGVPYFIGLFYYLIKMLRRSGGSSGPLENETKRRSDLTPALFYGENRHPRGTQKTERRGVRFFAVYLGRERKERGNVD